LNKDKHTYDKMELEEKILPKNKAI